MLTSGNVEQFKKLSKFNGIKKFNNSIEQWLLDNPFTKSEIIAFKRLVRYSASTVGVCYAKIQTLVSATHNNGIGISRSTFERMLRKAKKLGIISVHNTMKRGRKGHNVFVFNPYQSANEVFKSEKIDVSNKTINLSKTNNINTNVKSNGWTGTILDGQFVSSNIPSEFVNAVSAFFGQADQVYHLWSRLTLATRKYGSDSFILSHMHEYLKVFQESIYRLKQNKIKGEFSGYIYSAWERTTQLLTMKRNARTGLYYDWLSE